MTRVLVTGGARTLGSLVVDRCVKAGKVAAGFQKGYNTCRTIGRVK